MCESTELLFIEMANKNTLVGVAYRRPGTDFQDFYNNLNNVIDIVSRENKICNIVGDFNLDLLKFSQSQ